MVPLNRAINIILGLIVLVGSALWSYTYWEGVYRPPVKYLSVAVLTRTVFPGEDLKIRITFDRRRNCPTEFDRSITAFDNGTETVIFRDRVHGVPTAIGESINYIFTMPTPKNILPGTYIYNQIGLANCNGNIFSIEAPSASFRICSADDTFCKD